MLTPEQSPRLRHSIKELAPPITKPEGPCCWWMRDSEGNFNTGSASEPCSAAVVFQTKGSHGHGSLWCSEHSWFPGVSNLETWDGLSPMDECRLIRSRLNTLLHDAEKSKLRERERSLLITKIEEAQFWNERTIIKLHVATLTTPEEGNKVEA